MEKSSARFPIRLILCSALVCFATDAAVAAGKTTLLVPMEDKTGWRDMAFLAAVPASEIANDSGASLVAIDPAAGIGPEIGDYLRRYQPERIYLLDRPDKSSKPIQIPGGAGPQPTTLPATSAEQAALVFSRTFWPSSATAVICKDDDYESALVAAPLAALLKAPLHFATAAGISEETGAELQRLGATRVMSIGTAIGREGAINLAGAKEAMKWVTEQGIDIDYLAAVNPLDRADSKVVKLSMVGAQLAAGRSGLVAPLAFEVEWKKPFKSRIPEADLPADFQGRNPPALSGILQAGDAKAPYILSKAKTTALFLDPDGSGEFSGPIHTGDLIQLDGREWVVSLGQGASYHDSDVHITWPTADLVNSRLAEYYAILGAPPTFLCLAGLPDAIPHKILPGRVLSSDTVSDLVYAMPGDAEGSEIAVGRLVGEDVRFASLYAARVLTYSDLLDESWVNRATQAEWENGYGWMLANVGFDASYRLTDEQIPWAEKPEEGKKGKPAPSFAQDSPAARSNVLIHSNHSWNFELGRMMKWDATILFAPTLVESGGCGTTALDQRAPGQAIVEGADGMLSPELAVRHRSVVSRLLRLGGIGFVGGSRAMNAEQGPIRDEFWNGVLAGEPVGVAHRRSQNAGLLIIREQEKQNKAASYLHNLHTRMLLGDPAVSIKLPGGKQSAPARTELVGDRLTLHAPGHWDIFKLFVPPDWKKWVGRDIFIARASGAYSLCSWGPEERDVEIPMVAGVFHSDRKIKEMKLLDTPEPPLGWSGIWHTTRNHDGTYTHRIGARMLDLDQETGKALHSVDQLNFSVVFE